MCQEALDLGKNEGERATGTTKIMICGTCVEFLQSSGLFSFAVCHTRVGSNNTSATAASTGCISQCDLAIDKAKHPTSAA